MLLQTINTKLLELQKNIDLLRLEVAGKLLADRTLTVCYGRTTLGYTILLAKPIDSESVISISDTITLINNRLRPEYDSISVEVYHTATAIDYITIKIHF